MASDYVKCVICGGRFSGFLPFGVESRPNAQCPRCGSLERHRLLWLYLKKKTNFFKDRLKVFEVAPIHFLQEEFKKLPNIEYVSADISSSLAMKRIDITSIPIPSGKFDCIICYHVLEHIPDDKKAMRELFRILKPGGWAIIQSPIDWKLQKTVEGKIAMYKIKGVSNFWQHDHVRIYGRDYKNKLEKAGFFVNIDRFMGESDKNLLKRYGLFKNQGICYCTKPCIKNSARKNMGGQRNSSSL